MTHTENTTPCCGPDCCGGDTSHENHAVEMALDASRDIKTVVREKYASVVETRSCGCGPSCCEIDFEVSENYEGRQGYVSEADYSLGCGIPTDVSGISEGETVVDLGSGAGNDVFIARSLVGDAGKVIGVDFTPAMVRKARTNLEKLGYTNVEFTQGDIEDLPLPDGIADVIISNCVLNLVPDKQKAYAEMNRILRNGGRFAVSDIVTEGDLPSGARSVAELYAGCVSGAVQKNEYLAGLRAAGFGDLEIRKEKPYELTRELLGQYLAPAEVEEYERSGARVLSITVTGKKMTSAGKGN